MVFLKLKKGKVANSNPVENENNKRKEDVEKMENYEKVANKTNTKDGYFKYLETGDNYLDYFMNNRDYESVIRIYSEAELIKYGVKEIIDSYKASIDNVEPSYANEVAIQEVNRNVHNDYYYNLDCNTEFAYLQTNDPYLNYLMSHRDFETILHTYDRKFLANTGLLNVLFDDNDMEKGHSKTR